MVGIKLHAFLSSLATLIDAIRLLTAARVGASQELRARCPVGRPGWARGHALSRISSAGDRGVSLAVDLDSSRRLTRILGRGGLLFAAFVTAAATELSGGHKGTRRGTNDAGIQFRFRWLPPRCSTLPVCTPLLACEPV